MPRRASHTAAGAADPAPAVRLAPSWHVAPGRGPPPLLSACGRACAPAAEHRGAGARARQRKRNGTGAKMARCALCRMRSRHRRPSARSTNSIPWHACHIAGTEASSTCIRPLGRSAVGGWHLFGGRVVLSSRAPPRGEGGSKAGSGVVAGRSTRLEFRGAPSPPGMLRMRMHNTRPWVAARPMARVRALSLAVALTAAQGAIEARARAGWGSWGGSPPRRHHTARTRGAGGSGRPAERGGWDEAGRRAPRGVAGAWW